MRFLALDSLRGLFAIMVVLLHGPFHGTLFGIPLVRNSDIFVDFFFVLSGFVIAHSCTGHIADARALALFMIRRIGRLWPLHAAMLLLFVALTGAKPLVAMLLPGLTGAIAAASPPKFTLESLFLVHAFRNETRFWLNFPSWSISAEFWAYATFGLVCLIPFRMRRPAMAAIMLASALVIAGLLDPGFGAFFGAGLFRAQLGFFTGYIAYRLFTRIRHRRLRFASAMELVMAGMIVGLASGVGHGAPLRWLLPLPFALAIGIFALEQGRLSGGLRAPLFQMLGTRSYSIYMIHAFVYWGFGQTVAMAEHLSGVTLRSPVPFGDKTIMLFDFGPPLGMDAVAIGFVLLVVWLAGYSHRFIECPGRFLTARLVQKLQHRIQGSGVARPFSG
ncbi:acyltransferase family protein [Actibacterium sp. D379-3]